jgi:hypothetical protein
VHVASPDTAADALSCARTSPENLAVSFGSRNPRRCQLVVSDRPAFSDASPVASAWRPLVQFSACARRVSGVPAEARAVEASSGRRKSSSPTGTTSGSVAGWVCTTVSLPERVTLTAFTSRPSGVAAPAPTATTSPRVTPGRPRRTRSPGRPAGGADSTPRADTGSTGAPGLSLPTWSVFHAPVASVFCLRLDLAARTTRTRTMTRRVPRGYRQRSFAPPPRRARVWRSLRLALRPPARVSSSTRALRLTPVTAAVAWIVRFPTTP